MRLVDKLKQVLRARQGERGEQRTAREKPDQKKEMGNLPGGASAKEAAEASPQRAAELAD